MELRPAVAPFSFSLLVDGWLLNIGGMIVDWVRGWEGGVSVTVVPEN
jgi:hypothetical protein